ncbi:MAG TPA: ATP-binding protein [Thermoanaerobaculia bacterium]|nr:ATP-binding protein [Thermoanaerobaculia bacterium]
MAPRRAVGGYELRLAPAWPAVAAVVVMTAVLAGLLPPLFERVTAAQLGDSLAIVERLVVPHLDDPPEELQRRVSSLAARTSLRITVIRPDGVVVADSDRTWAEVGRMENHAGRPEVVAALAGERGSVVRRSDTTSRDYLYLARPVASSARAGTGAGTAAPAGWVLRLAQPMDQLAVARRWLAEAVLWALLVALAAAALLSLWIDRRLLQPLAAVIAGTRTLAATGRYDQRLPVEGGEGPLPELATAVNRLAERVDRQIAALGAERDHLQVILASMSEGVLVVDGDGRAVLANPALRELFALPDDVGGRLPFELVRQPELADVIRETLELGTARRDEVILEDGRGARTVALAGAALRAPLAATGSPGQGGAVVVARDTTELSRLARARTDLVANVSHELKTPLAAIRGYAETLRDGALAEPETARRFTTRILEQCRRLQELLSDLLTLSRLESVEAPLERRPVDLARLAERAVETVAARAAERGVELALVLPPGAALPAVDGDPAHLERLLLNLLDNASKYNRPGGSVTVRLAASAQGEAVLEVADTGIGIPADALPRIFERFYRVDKGRAREEGGTGLGLAIVKHIAQAHGGRVEVESRVGRGTTLRVHLPLEPGVTRRPAASPAGAAAGNGAASPSPPPAR